MSSEYFKEAKKRSIVEYLEKLGSKPYNKGKYTFFSSPFSSDSTPSFCVYPSNIFIDYSTGFKGDIITLVSKIENCSPYEASKKILNNSIPEYIKEHNPVEKQAFQVMKFITTNSSDIEKIDAYAKSRGISYGYVHSYFYEHVSGDIFRRMLSVGFIHRDYGMNICGIKMRAIDKKFTQRFTAKGSLRYYVLEHIISLDPIVFIVESESSANSLHKSLKKINISFVVISFGGVGNVQKTLPEKYNHIKKRYVIIDYDNNEESYQKRLRNYDKLGCEEIRLELNKGEDINSLYYSGESKKYISEILNKLKK